MAAIPASRSAACGSIATSAAEVIERLQPLGIEAALGAQAARSRANEEKRRQVELALEQARYEVGRARRQYDAVDPDNRLVAAELETAMERAAARSCAIWRPSWRDWRHRPQTDLTPAERERLMTLGADLRARLDEPRCDTRDTKADRPHADRRDRRPRRGQCARSGDPLARRRPLGSQGARRTAPVSIAGAPQERRVDLVRVLARQMPDKAIAAVLNRAGKTTGRGNGWTQSRVCSLRSHNDIATYREGERRERGEVTLDEAAAALSVSPSTVRRLIKDGQLAASQLCKGAPWIIRAADLERADVKRAATARRLRRPPSGDPLQKELEL